MANFINEIKVDGNNYPIAINNGCVSTAFTISDDNGELGLNLSKICLEDSGIKVKQNGSISVNYGEGLMMDGNKLKLFLGSKGPLKIDSCDGNSLSMNYGNGLKVGLDGILGVDCNNTLGTGSDGKLGVKLGNGLTISDKGIALDTEAIKPEIPLSRITSGVTSALTHEESGIYLYSKDDGTDNHQIIFRFFEQQGEGCVCETRICAKSPIKDSGANPYTPPTIDYRIGTSDKMSDWTPLFNTNGGGTTASVDGHTLKLQ